MRPIVPSTAPLRWTAYALQAIPPIHIIVNNGKVTLVGVADSDSDKNVAGLKANGVSGVFSVDNQIQIAKSDPK